MNLKVSSIAFIGVYNCTDGEAQGTPIFFSHYINLIEPSGSVTTPSVVTVSATQSDVSTGTQVTTVQTAASSTATTSSDHDDGGSSKAVAIGAGVGGGIGGALLIAAVIALFMFRKRHGGKDDKVNGNTTPQTLAVDDTLRRQYVTKSTVYTRPEQRDEQGYVQNLHVELSGDENSSLRHSGLSSRAELG